MYLALSHRQVFFWQNDDRILNHEDEICFEGWISKCSDLLPKPLLWSSQVAPVYAVTLSFNSKMHWKQTKLRLARQRCICEWLLTSRMMSSWWGISSVKCEWGWSGLVCLALPTVEFQNFQFAVLQFCMSSSLGILLFLCPIFVIYFSPMVCLHDRMEQETPMTSGGLKW